MFTVLLENMEPTSQNGCINEEDQPIKIENIKSNHNDYGLLQKRYELNSTIIIIYWLYVVTLNTVITKI